MYVIWVFYLNMPDFIDVTLIQTYKLQSLFTHNADMLHLFSAYIKWFWPSTLLFSRIKL